MGTGFRGESLKMVPTWDVGMCRESELKRMDEKMRNQTIIVLLLALMMVAALNASADEPKNEDVVIRGAVTNSAGNEVPNVRLKVVRYRVYNYGQAGEWHDKEDEDDNIMTESDGTWEYSFGRYGDYEIFIYSSDTNFETTQKCIPRSYGDEGNWPAERGVLVVNSQNEFSGKDFLIHPRVSGAIPDRKEIPNSPNPNFKTSATGTKVYVGNTLVDTITSGETGYSFYPDEVGVGLTGSLFFSKPFHRFYNIYHPGELPTYDASHVKAAYATLSVSPYIDEDAPIGKSWTGSGEDLLGFLYFPLTPDNRVPNNPNIWVEMDFQLGSEIISRDDIYIMSDAFSDNPSFKINPDHDLTPSNGHIAQFQTPIQTCASGEVSLWVKTIVKYGDDSVRYVPVGIGDAWKTSTSNFDLFPDGVLNSWDVVELAPCIGLCPEDAEYQENGCECANFFPDEGDCIDLAEIGIFSNVYYMEGGKASLNYSTEVNVSGEICQDGDVSGCSGISVNSDSGWDAVLVEFEFGDGENIGLEWLPAPDFEGRSALTAIPNQANHWGLWVFGPSAGGDETVGRLVQVGDKSSVREAKWDGVFSFGAGGGRVNSQGDSLPDADKAIGAFPNPFNPQTTISFFLKDSRDAILEVYSVDGKRVKVLKTGHFLAGKHEVTWRGDDDMGRSVASGGYFFRLSGDHGATLQGKMTLIK
jgi:hypothetical protein